MDELQATSHKFERESDQLTRLLDRIESNPEYARLALIEAKRVRRTSTLLVRHLASLRDKLQPKEGTST